MRILFTALLHILHLFYIVILRILHLWRQWSSPEPLPLQTARKRIPRHLAILFVVESNSNTETTKSALIESTLRVVKWSRTIGVKKLTVYEENGLLSHCVDVIRSVLSIKHSDCSESEEEYQPPTPPLSDYADSLTLLPGHGDSNIATLLVTEPSFHEHGGWVGRPHHVKPTSSKDDLLVCLISRSSSKPAIASTAQKIAATQTSCWRRNSRSQKITDFGITVDQLDRLLEDERGLSSPDFMIIHHLDSSGHSSPPELHGFPPWQIRLTEIFQDHIKFFGSETFHIRRSSLPHPSILDERTFRKALDEFGSVEMRFGK